MTEHGFTHMIEWSNVAKLAYGSRSHTEFYALNKAASKLFGQSWSRHFNNTGKWASLINTHRAPPRLYFKSEKYISLVLMSVDVPA